MLLYSTVANRQLAVSDSTVHDTTAALQQARSECASALHTIEQERVAASEALAAAATAYEEELGLRSAAAADAAVEVRHSAVSYEMHGTSTRSAIGQFAVKGDEELLHNVSRAP
jgi:hypothetical protein